MILLADSGSTKADWVTIKDGKPDMCFETPGFNPFYHTTESLFDAFKQSDDMVKYRDAVERLYFYGAGCSDDIQIGKITKAFKAFFQNAQHIHVGHDLEGAVFATCGTEPGIACILGTGSNSCYFDGTDIHQNTLALGLYLGDEGSGGAFGKELCRRFFYNQLPDDLAQELKDKYKLEKSAFLDRIYCGEKSNTYLASFFPFAVEHKEHPYVRQMIREGFNAFIDNHILCYEEAQNGLPIHFIGSVAYLFQDILKEALDDQELVLGRLVQKPLEGMLKHIALLK